LDVQAKVNFQNGKFTCFIYKAQAWVSFGRQRAGYSDAKSPALSSEAQDLLRLGLNRIALRTFCNKGVWV